ncbi:MAG: calcium-translocating P-type ATPase, SERCA-type [Candidatus Aenigmarchaeota archaeon]|nr:calcium-translocating P-type ATPase, SERCA-type [Candidatus Aenigmarchaeota archaeon]
MMKEWHRMTAEEALKALESGRKGLSKSESSRRLNKYGRNELVERKKTSGFRLFLQQFASFLVIILIVAAVVSFAVGEAADAAVISAIILLNALFGFVQERKAEKALESLKKFAAPQTTVVRGGEKMMVDASSVVPGDILYMEAGSRVPADSRVMECSSFKVDESVLTGESVAVTKNPAPAGSVMVADRKDMVYMGTTAVYGTCTAVVVGTGMKTEFGKIAENLQVGEEKTPLQKNLGALGRNIGVLIILICAAVFAAGMARGMETVEIFLVAVSLAVAAIPEGLPAVVTITLAIGLVRMAKKNSIVRKLPAVETLGAATVICSDKTGTLTKNEMTVRKVYVPGRIMEVTGDGYSATGYFLEGGKRAESGGDVRLLLETGMFCNNASLGESAVGDPTEIALLVSAGKLGLEKEGRRVHEIPFDSQRKLMSVVYQKGNQRIMYTKGAVEEVLKRCKGIQKDGRVDRLTEKGRKEIMDINDEFGKAALRVLAFAYRKISRGYDEGELIFAGLQGMLDPPRPEVKSSIEQCKKAGIKVVMITGDHMNTAVAIAKELGIADGGRVLTGEDMESMSDDSFGDIVNDVSVYARVSPEHKVRIAEALKKKGHVVAMTGDGVNDAPALKNADIGVSMGISGTDVSKEASDMVLADDNFATIVGAVKEGREIYDNIKKFVYYLLACNMGEVMTIFTSILIGFPLPLLPLQILWMNLITDGLPALALGVEPSDPDTMQRKPRRKDEKIIGRRSLLYILSTGVLMAAITLGVFYYYMSDYSLAITMAFTTLVFLQISVAMSIRSREPVHRIGYLKNRKLVMALASVAVLQALVVNVPFFNPVFKTVSLGAGHWLVVIGAMLALFILLEAEKLLRRSQINTAPSNYG